MDSCRMLRIGVIAALTATAPTSFAIDLWQLTPNNIQFSQVNLTYDGAAQSFSQYGMAAVNLNNALAAADRPLERGYINVRSQDGWIVRNMPVDLNSQAAGISTMFDLGVTPGTPVTSREFAAYLSDEPVVDFTPPGSGFFSMGFVDHNAQGAGGGDGSINRPVPPSHTIDTSVVNFTPGAATKLSWQPGHPNIEQDTNQCYPASVANSLQWLENTQGINVPHAHNPGIRDNTLAGQLDIAMGRQAHQLTPTAIGMLRGKLTYIDTNDLADDLMISHKQRTGITWLNGDQTVGAATSVEDTSNTSLVNWIIAQIQAGKDVEIRIGWDGGGGHAVQLTGAGTILGVPWLSWAHDADQGHDGNAVDINGGVSWFDGGLGWSPVVNDRIVAYIGGQFLTGTVDFAIAEMIPAPGSIVLLVMGVTFGTTRRRR